MPYLQNKGSFFYYCGSDGHTEGKFIKEGAARHEEIRKRHLPVVDIRLYCTGDFKFCAYYAEKPAD